MLLNPQISSDVFGGRFVASKFARPYRYKSRKARTNDRTSNKKKLRSERVFK